MSKRSKARPKTKPKKGPTQSTTLGEFLAEKMGETKPAETPTNGAPFKFIGTADELLAAADRIRKERTEQAEAQHPGIPVPGAYHDTFHEILGFDGEYTFCNGDPFATASIGEMFGWYLGGSTCANDIWSPLRDQAQAIRDLMNAFHEYHSDLPDSYSLSGEWTERANDIARRLEVLAWLHHKTVTEIRMSAVRVQRAEVQS